MNIRRKKYFFELFDLYGNFVFIFDGLISNNKVTKKKLSQLIAQDKKNIFLLLFLKNE